MHAGNRVIILSLLCGLSLTSPVSAQPADGKGAIAAQRAWWKAFIVADTASLQARTAGTFTLTLSSGKTYDRATMLVEAASHTQGKEMDIEWGDELVQVPEPTIAIVTSRVKETAGPTNVFRYVTILHRQGKEWRVAAAQTTRELDLTPRVPIARAGTLSDYAGSYLTPKGAVLRVVAHDAGLALVEPSGKELPLEPVGLGIFELDRLSLSNGLVRIVFLRDETGKVVSMNRLLSGAINSFARMP